MGGQACILYGAAEFSRDVDLAIGTDAENLTRVQSALDQLKAEPVFVPRLEPDVLKRGHACHLRCHTPETEGLRVDLMAKMRGCDDFSELWRRRTIIELPEIGRVGLLSLPDLVQAKKTQREKDWPMIRRLIEANIIQFRDTADEPRVRFWLRECRTPAFLIELAQEYPDLCRQVADERPLLQHAGSEDVAALQAGLSDEEAQEKEADRRYWMPLKQDIEKWRRERRQQ